MAYIEPGVIVRTELTSPGVVVQSADQDPVIVGELWEVFEEEAAATRYNATLGSGSQVFAWPSKLTSSIVDLAGIRSDTLEPDDQLLAGATFPMVVKLQDPETLVESTVDLLLGVEAVSQAGFTLLESVSAATARTSGSNATAGETLKIYRESGGFIAAGIKAGDKIRVVYPQSASAVARGAVTAVTDNQITFTSVDAVLVDGALLTNTAPDFGDANTNPGRLNYGPGFTGVTVGDRVAIYTEAAQVNDGNGVNSSSITTASGLALVQADIGRKVSLYSARPADGAVTEANAATSVGLATITGAGFTAAMIGRAVKISGGSPSIPTTYARVIAAVVGQITVSSSMPSTSTDVTVLVYAQVVRTIVTVVAASQFTYSGASISDALQVAIPVVLHTKVTRNVTALNSATQVTYSGNAVTSGTGFARSLPFEDFNNNVQYQVFPDYMVLVTYRAMNTTLVDGQRVATQEAVDLIGAVHKANPVCFAASKAMEAMGTTDRNILLIGVNLWGHQSTPTGFPADVDESAAYARAFSVLSNDSAAYFLAALTRNHAVRTAVIAHCNAMSQPTEKRERTCFLSYALPLGTVESTTGGIEPGLDGGNKKILDTGVNFVSEFSVVPGMNVVIVKPTAFAGTYVVAAGTADGTLLLDGADWTITPLYTVANGDLTAVSGQVSTVTPNAWEDVDVGDWIRVGVGPYQFRRVSSKVSSLILGYEGVPLVGVAQTVSIIRSYLSPNEPVSYYVDPLTNTEQATALKGIAQSLAQFRAVPVWPDLAGFVTGQDGQGNDVIELLPSYFLAAVAAGVCSVLPPERSLTGMAIGGVVSLSNSSDKFSTSQLNTIADGGWSIFHVPNTGGSVQCRHLMSSDRSSIKRQELSVTKNVDNQAKVLRNSLRPSLNDAEGRVNITQRFLQALALPIQGILDVFVANEQLVVGPNGEAPYALIDIRQDPVALDTILVEVQTTQPIPANIVDITYVI